MNMFPALCVFRTLTMIYACQRGIQHGEVCTIGSDNLHVLLTQKTLGEKHARKSCLNEIRLSISTI